MTGIERMSSSATTSPPTVRPSSGASKRTRWQRPTPSAKACSRRLGAASAEVVPVALVHGVHGEQVDGAGYHEQQWA
ncbi:hypothetical protein [Streptomyces aureocirculatus]|uniref:hypothetical protein n=1 Tax=Streptomyces aureocirculatus TaxID=67275 RepID=UPI00146FDB4C|nr:hypothetical protein [Streptomyces aureocirculatus]